MTPENAALHWSLLQVLSDKVEFTRENLTETMQTLFNSSFRTEAQQRAERIKHIYSLPHPSSMSVKQGPKSSEYDVSVYKLLRATLGHYIYTFSWPNISKNIEVYFFMEKHQKISARRVYSAIEGIANSWRTTHGSLYLGLSDAFNKSPVSVSRMLKSLATYLLQEAVNVENLILRAQLYEELQIQALPWSLCYGLDEALLSMSHYLSDHNKINLDKGHKAEPIAAIKGFIQDINHCIASETLYLFVWGGVTIRGNKKEKQIDGMWVTMERAVFKLYLIESKTTKAKPDKCQDLLREKLLAVGVSEGVLKSAETIAIGALAGGFCFRVPPKKTV